MQIPKNRIVDNLAVLIEARCTAKFLERAVLLLYEWVFVVHTLAFRRSNSNKGGFTARLKPKPVIVGRGVRVIGIQQEYRLFRIFCNDEVVPEEGICAIISPIAGSDAGEKGIVKKNAPRWVSRKFHAAPRRVVNDIANKIRRSSHQRFFAESLFAYIDAAVAEDPNVVHRAVGLDTVI